MAYAAVTFLSDNLTDMLTNHPDLIHAAEREEILQLQDELSQLKHVLGQRACAKEGRMVDKETGEAYQQVEREVREAVYQVEDAIDTVISKRRKSMSRRKSGRMIPRLVSISTTRLEIKEFTLRPLINNLQTEFALVRPIGAAGHESHIVTTDTTELQPTRLKPLKATMREYVGQEDDLETLINRITAEESDQLKVVSVFGMEGLGKTTMARRIFRDPRITEEFPILIWVTISEEFDMESFCLTILKSYTSRDMSGKTCEELLVIVPEYLRMGKFFMVIDDLWTQQAWEQIKQVLPMKNRNSRVLITTRVEEVAHFMSGDKGYPHSMRLLNEEENWYLLKQEVFGHDCPLYFEDVGRAIAIFCKGSPLSILITAGTLKKLVSKSTLPLREQFIRVLRSLKDSVYEYDNIEALFKTMSWCYHALPDYLKDCFLYMGRMHPAETEIPVWKVTQLWIAEGLVRQKQGQALEDTAKDYLMELINTNFFMVDKISLHGGEPKTFHVHGLIHEFCSREANNQNLFQEIIMGQQDNEPPSEGFGRHLCVNSDVNDFLSKEPKVEMARTFLCFSSSPVILQNEDVSKFTNAFDLVRVLEAHSIKFPRFPTKLTQLAHLRYITLSCDELKILPADISNLWNLQTLVVDTKSPTLEVKADIWKLMHLRFLKTRASMTLMKSNGNGCENLHTLTRLSPQSFTSEVPNKAKKLKVLGIRGMLSDSLSFEKLDSLEKLKLQHDVYPRKQSEYPLAALPQPDMFPPNLRFLVLSGTYLDWKHVSVVGNLPTLVALKLKDNAFKGATWEVADGGFKRLEALSINEAELKYWTASSSSFPELRNLELNNCEKLLEVPLELGKTLEKLSMSCVTRYAVSCAEKIKQARAQDSAEFKLEIRHGDM